MAQKLQDYCWHWLEPEERMGAHVAEVVVLEQFTQILPSGGREWVNCHHPTSLSEAITLMEDYLTAEESEV